ncbi:hypothetical protein [Sandarakinorhabdus sp.]|uniref:hypothetical protein n=1 Tax=Sandarakinorhabdus sp. TaxID=1916663 RepID=UPI00286E82AA|nr:hypothetical protein [Sandarakinorhabdus sp.]
MADYRVTKVQTLPGLAGNVIDRLSGPGWTDTAHNVLGHLQRSAHRFYIESAAGRLWLAPDPRDDTAVVATREDGVPVAIDDLPLVIDQQMTSPLPRKIRGLWQRFIDAGSQL